MRIAEHTLADLVDLDRLQRACDGLSAAGGIGTAVLDPRGAVLVAAGWQDICTQYHRVHEETLRGCIESDLRIDRCLRDGNEAPSYHAYRCANGLWDVAFPLIIAGEHLGTVVSGQFFYDDDEVDEAAFRRRAQRLGFDEPAYLEALARVPRLSHEHVAQTLSFLAEFVGVLADLGLSALRLEQEREALRASEAIYRSILSASPDDITITDLEGLVRMASPAAVATFGCEREEEMVGRSLTEFLAPGDRERAQANVALMQQGVFTGPSDYRGLRADGSTFAIEANAEFVHDADEQPTGIVFIIRDISARESAEEAVTRQGEQLRLLYEASQRLSSTLDLDDIYQTIRDFMSIIAPNYGFFISAFDHETQLITCHACWMEDRWLDVSSFPQIPLEEEGRGTQSIVIRTGRSLLINDYQAQQQTAQSVFYIDAETGAVSSEITPDEDITRSALIVPLTIGGVVRGVIQVMSYRQDAYTEAQLRLLEALALHIASAEQNALLYAQVQTELNERTQAEEHLAAAAGQWRQTFDAMSDSVTLFDREGRVLRCNAATVAFTGRAADDIVGRRCFEVFHGTAAFHPDCPQRRAVDSGQTETSTIEQDGH